MNKNKAKEEIKNLIDDFKQNYQKYKKELEANTETKLVEPLFQILGWNKNDFIKREKSHRGGELGFADYASYIGDKIVFFLEVKKVGVSLEKEAYKQVISYALSKRVPFAVATNFEEFKITSTSVEEPKPSNIRKRDKLVTYSSRFYISISALNTIRFSEFIDFPFNEEKRIATQEAVKEAKAKISRMNLQVDKYDKAIKLYQEGYSIYEISKKLNIQWHTANNWLITKKHLPVLLQNTGEVKNEI